MLIPFGLASLCHHHLKRDIASVNDTESLNLWVTLFSDQYINMERTHGRVFFWSQHPSIRRRSQNTTLHDIFASMANETSCEEDDS